MMAHLPAEEGQHPPQERRGRGLKSQPHRLELRHDPRALGVEPQGFDLVKQALLLEVPTELGIDDRSPVL